MNISDSDDDDLLPSFDKLNAMFNQVQKQARQAAPSVVKPSSSSTKVKSSKKESSTNKPDPGGKRGVKKSPPSKDKAKDSKGRTKVEISEDTKMLLEEIDKLTDPIKISTVNSEAHSSKSILSHTSKSSKETAKLARGRGRGRGKGRGRKKVMEEVVQVSDDDDCVVEAFDASFGNLSDMDVMVVEPEELCSLRIRWKNQLLRFSVPKSTKMSRIRMDLAEQVSTRADNLVIMDDVNSEEISDDTSVDSIPFGETLEAFEREIINNNSNLTVKNLEPGFVLIKLQGCGGYRERCVMPMKKTTHVKQLIEDYKKKFGYQGKTFKLVFDGEDLDLTETPESLDLENNDMIDIVEI